MAKKYISYEWLHSNSNQATVADWAPTNNNNDSIRTTTYCTDTEDLLLYLIMRSASGGATVYVV